MSSFPPTITFVREGHPSLVADPAFNDMLWALRREEEQTLADTVKAFLSYVITNPESPNYYLLNADDFFTMRSAISNPKHISHCKWLVTATNNLVTSNRLNFIAPSKNNEKSVLTALLETPTSETAKQSLSEVSEKLETILNNQEAFRPVSSVIENTMQEAGDHLLSMDVAIQFLQRAGNGSIESLQYHALQKRVSALFESSMKAVPFNFLPGEQRSNGWKRVQNLFDQKSLPSTPVARTAMASQGFVAFSRPTSTLSFIDVPPTKK